MARRKLLIILGAGSSIDQGMPSVADIDKCMKVWSADWLRSDPALPPVRNYFEALWQNLDAWYRGPFLGPGRVTNFEDVLADMVALAQWVAPPPGGNGLHELLGGHPNPLFPDAEDEKSFSATVNVNSQLGYLLNRLAMHMRDRSRTFDTAGKLFGPYRELINALRHQFEIGVYNLNYDNVALSACPGFFTGFDSSGRFDPAGVHQRDNWNFIYHMHGSVHHTLNGSSPDAIHWQQDLSATDFKDGDDGQAIVRASDRKSLPRSTLIAGGFKLDQLLVEPFHSYYSSFTRQVYEADAILIAGYGFGDVHLNRTLQNRLGRGPHHPGGRPPVVVLAWAGKDEYMMQTRDDLWSHEMRAALVCPGDFTCYPERPSSQAANLVPPRSFQVAPNHSVAVWQGGFLDAVGVLAGIIEWLDGNLSPKWFP